MKRRALLVLTALGIGLVLAPVVFQMFERAPKGATMLDDFEPFMTEKRLSGFRHYIRQIDAAVEESGSSLQPFLAEHGVPASDPRVVGFTTFEQQWPQIDTDMSDLIRRVRNNVDNYEAIRALPSFTLFPWFFVIPGVLIAAVASTAAWRAKASAARPKGALVFLAGLGLGLVAAPFIFQMFDRAPKGAEMMDDFTTIMTRRRVHTIQGYFGTMSVGQGAIRLGLIPAARDAGGLTDAQIPQQFPAVVELDADWIGIINDMTPMIGAMSDNVESYDAVRALPSFTLFPWFFVAPGVIVAGIAGWSLRKARHRPAAPDDDHARGSSKNQDSSVPSTPHQEAPIMSTHRLGAVLASLALGLTAFAVPAAAAPSGHAAKSKPLVGTFEIDPGECDASGAASGSYFRMVFPGGSLEQGKFFENPDSTCANKAYTLAVPGSDGGLVTGTFQPQPDPAFDPQGSALADRIVAPQPFSAIKFSVSTNAIEPQTVTTVKKPVLKVSKGKISGDLRAFTASWNNAYFNQGAPKPDGSKPGLTTLPHGTYDAKTKRFVLEWASQVVGGPFNDFTGVWHLEGVLEPRSK